MSETFTVMSRKNVRDISLVESKFRLIDERLYNRWCDGTNEIQDGIIKLS